MPSLANTPTHESTAALLQAADQKHSSAWEELFRRYNGLVRSTVASFRLHSPRWRTSRVTRCSRSITIASPKRSTTRSTSGQG